MVRPTRGRRHPPVFPLFGVPILDTPSGENCITLREVAAGRRSKQDVLIVRKRGRFSGIEVWLLYVLQPVLVIRASVVAMPDYLGRDKDVRGIHGERNGNLHPVP